LQVAHFVAHIIKAVSFITECKLPKVTVLLIV